MTKKISEYTALVSAVTGDLFEIVDISDLTDAATGTNKKITLDNLSSSSFLLRDTDDLTEGITNEYYTEAKVSANTDVAANTAAKHTQGTDTTIGPMTADINMNDNDLLNIKSAEFTPKIIGNLGASKTIPFIDGGVQTATVDQITTVTITSPTDGGRMTLTLSGGASFAVTWSGVTWLTSGGTAPTLTATDVITFYNDGTTTYAAISNQA